MVILYPSQCKCGHIFLEKYEFPKATPRGDIGFCWCGFCQTKLMVKAFPNKALNRERAKSGSVRKAQNNSKD